MAQVQQGGTPVLLSSSGAISVATGTMIGYHVNSTSGGTIVIGNGSTSGATAVTGTITPGVGFTAFPGYFTSGAYATIAGTISVTFFFAAG